MSDYTPDLSPCQRWLVFALCVPAIALGVLAGIVLIGYERLMK